MKSIVTQEVFAKFPLYIRGIVIAKGINNQGENPQLLELLRKEEQAATQNPLFQEIKNHPRIANWRQAYTAFGSNPNKFYSSIESLCRRARRGDQLPYINTAVALFNYFSLKNVVPSGADDLANVAGDLRLTIAKGNEPFTPFNAEEIEYPEPGEVIYITGSVVMCRRWNWRQGRQSKLLPETMNIVINVDCLPPVFHPEAESLTAGLAGLVREFCGGEVKYFLLTREHNEFEI